MTCLILFESLARAAASRTLLTAGSKRAINIAGVTSVPIPPRINPATAAPCPVSVCFDRDRPSTPKTIARMPRMGPAHTPMMPSTNAAVANPFDSTGRRRRNSSSPSQRSSSSSRFMILYSPSVLN